jgi:hypothetical protein
MMSGARTLLVVSLLVLSFANVMMSSASSIGSGGATGTYQPGVHVGEWWQSSIRLCATVCRLFSSSLVWQNSSVVNVVGDNVTLQNAVLFSNGTSVTTTIVQNLEAGQPGIPYYLTAANLTDGDHVYNSTSSLTITGNQTMMVLGAERNVTQALHFIPEGNFEIGEYDTWDRLTGIMISGQLLMYGENATITLTATNAWSPTPDFSLSLFPYSQIMPSNGTVYTIFVQIGSVYGFSGNVSLTALSNSTLFQAKLLSSLVKVTSGYSIYTDMNVYSNTVGDYSVNVTATSGSLTHSAIFQAFVMPLTIGSFTLTTDQDSIAMLPANMTTINLSVTSIDNFTGPVYLSAILIGPTGSDVNDPFGPRVSLNTNELSMAMNRTDNTVLTVETPNFPVKGHYTIELGASGGIPGINRNVNVTLTILSPDFTLKTNPNTISISPNASANSTVTVRGYGIFGPINLKVSVSPAGAECSLNATTISFVLGPISEGNTTLTCHGSPGNYTVVITASSGSLQHSTNVTLTVEGPNSKPPTSSGFSLFGLPTVESYGVISTIIAVVLALAGTGVYLLRRKPSVRKD